MSRTLFVQFEVEKWTANELDTLVDGLEDALPEDVNVIAVPEDIEYMRENEVKSFIEMLTDLVEEE